LFRFREETASTCWCCVVWQPTISWLCWGCWYRCMLPFMRAV